MSEGKFYCQVKKETYCARPLLLQRLPSRSCYKSERPTSFEDTNQNTNQIVT